MCLPLAHAYFISPPKSLWFCIHFAPTDGKSVPDGGARTHRERKRRCRSLTRDALDEKLEQETTPMYNLAYTESRYEARAFCGFVLSRIPVAAFDQGSFPSI